MKNGQDDAPATKRSRPNRWSNAPSTDNNKSTSSAPPKTKALAQSIAQRLAALKQKKLAAAGGAVNSTLKTDTSTGVAVNAKKRSLPSLTPAVNTLDVASTSAPTSDPSASSLSTSQKRAKVYDFDMTVISKPTSTFQKAKPVPKKNPYLAHRETTTTTTETDPSPPSNFPNNIQNDSNDLILDGRLAGGQMEKQRKRHKALTFVQPGTYIELAERKREKAMNAQQSGFTSGRKVGLHHKSVGIVSGIDTNSKGGDDQGYYGHSAGSSEKTKDELDGLLPPRADSVADDTNISSTSIGAISSSTMPLIMEWWDLELLPSKLKKEVATKEGKDMAKRTRKRMDMTQSTDEKQSKDEQQKKEQEENEKKQIMELQSKCFILASISNSKTSSLIQHPQPILPLGHREDLASNSQSTQGVLHLTKKEMKRQRKLRRAEKQREQQDLQAAGLIPPPEPKLTLSNFMRVMGNQAVMDPSQMEKVVLEQMQSRKLKHEMMNEDRKLSKEARSLKRKNKLLKENVDTTSTSSVSVALFLVKDMGHPYHRAKVDLNAQQMEITGGVLECFDEDGSGDGVNLSLVIAEGGTKAIKKYIRLMMVRMKWKGEQFVNESDEEDEDNIEEEENTGEKGGTKKFNPNNSCELVWTGLAPKRMFNSFMFQSCSSSKAARKILEAKGVAHFWDQVLVHANGKSDSFNFKLGRSETPNEELDQHSPHEDNDDDVVMKEAF